jgi:D-3-phosphoglycerate dehydrogenase / 2-oxoglutarate reductase
MKKYNNKSTCLLGITGVGTRYPEEVRGYLGRNNVELIENARSKVLNEEELLEVIPGVDAVLASVEPYTARVLGAAERLRVISRVGVGYNNIDLAAATKEGISVTWTPIPELAYAVAEHAFAHILSFAKKIPLMNRDVREGRWESEKWSTQMVDLYGSTIGLLGLGRIGSEVARRAKAFRMKVIYYDVVRRKDLEKSLGLTYVSFDMLFSEADVVSIHTPLTPETRGIVDRRAIGLMKKDAVLVNTARGPIVEEAALAEALESGKIGGACLDVLSEEPPTGGHAFYKLGDRLPNLILTPHLDYGPRTARVMIMTAAEDLVRVLNGQRPRYLLNQDVIPRKLLI